MAFGSGYLGNFAQNALNQEKFNASQSTPYSFDDGTSASNEAMQAQQQQLQAYSQMQRQQAYMSTPGGRLGAAAGGLLDSIVGGIRGATNFNGMPSSPQQAQQLGQAATTDQSADLKQAFAQNVSSIMQTNSTSDAPTNMGQVYYEAASNLAKDPRFQGRPDLAPYVAKAINWETKNMGFSPAKPLSPEDQQQKLLNDQKTQQSLAENMANKQYQVVDMTDDGSGVPTWKPYGDPISLFNPDGTPNKDYAAQVMAAKKLAASNGAKNIMTMPQKDFYDSKNTAERQKALDAQSLADHKQSLQEQAASQVDPNWTHMMATQMYNGEATPSDLASEAGQGATGTARREAVGNALAEMERVGGPGMTPTEAAAKKTAQRAWLGGGSTGPGNQLARGETAASHLDLLEQIMPQLQNGTFKPGTALWNRAMELAGIGVGTKIDAFNLAKQIMAGEMQASFTNRPGENSVDKLASFMKTSNTPDTLQNTINTERSLWAANMDTLRYRYEREVKGGNFYTDMLNNPETIKRYSYFKPMELKSGNYGKMMYDKAPDGTYMTYNGVTGVKGSDGQLRPSQPNQGLQLK